jgi:hypothetical protein
MLVQLNVLTSFDVLLTVHLGITVANDQLVTQFLYFIICLLQSSTCFEQRRAHHQEVILLIQHLVSSLSVSGCAMHLCTGRPLTESEDTRCCINTIRPHDDEHDVARNM